MLTKVSMTMKRLTAPDEKVYLEQIWQSIVEHGRTRGHRMDYETFRNMNPWNHITWEGSNLYKTSKFMAQCTRCKTIIQVEFRDYKPYGSEYSAHMCSYFGSMK